MDRTELIIRIFEAHARDSASRLEVELADLEYRLPRIKGGNSSFSRLGGGGFTTRGSGEQQLEYDRREIRDKISLINRRLKDETAAREVRSRRRKDSQSPPSVALVGYTNAGKTTILNALTGAGRSTKDRLFETLETTTRLVEGSTSDNGSESRPDFVITDTVGFIQKLPTQLVHSFASTLESARDADIIVICADASSDELESHISTVRDTLSGSLGENYVLCLNKSDLLNKDDRDSVLRRNPGAVLITARQNVSLLLDEIYDRISSRRHRFTLLIPHDQYGAASALYDLAEIHSSSSTERGVLLDATLPSNLASRYEKYTVSQTGSLST
jgi:GTP-binding protein HflX